MTIAQGVLIFLVLVVILVFILLYSGRFQPPDYPKYGR